MFHSFFPKPKLFFLSFALWALVCVIGWYAKVQDLGNVLSLGSLFGIYFPEALAEGADAAAQAAFQSAQSTAFDVWLYQYMAVCYGLFIGGWVVYGGQKWAKWSVVGSGLIVFITWFQVQVSVMLNEWYGSFYDLIQKALAEPNSILLSDYYAELSTVAVIIMVAITVSVLSNFFVSHYVFRWRTAMTS